MSDLSGTKLLRVADGRQAVGRPLLTVLVLLAAAGSFRWAPASAADDPDVRAAATEARMTDVERFQLLHGVMSIPIPGHPAGPAGRPITAGYIEGAPRLGIPDIVESDASLGVVNPQQLRVGDVATALPSGLALAASFDPEAAFAGGALIGAEARAKGFNVLLGGGANLARDPRNGRNFEYLGEDPLLAGLLAGAEVRGTQSQGVISTVKHFALNDQETLRLSLDARIDEASLRESDLLAFELAIETGQPGAVMCAYNKVNGSPACGNDWLLNEVLKREWGFKGWVMSDWGAVGAASWLAKGLDQQSGAQLDRQVWFDAPLRAELAAGRLTHEQVSAAVRRILRSLYAVGADKPASSAPIDYPGHASIARRIAGEGIVLLKNEGVLPLTTGLKKILVIGGHADIGVLSGGGSSQVTPYGGPAAVIPVGGHGLMAPWARQLYMPSPPVGALREQLSGVLVEYDPGYDVTSAAASASFADVAIVFATQWQAEGSDAGSISLPQGQDALIAAVAASNPNTIVVLESGNPVAMPWLNHVKAVVEAWYPGQAGGAAIADVLTGAVNPSGRLPISFPLSEQQLPREKIIGLGQPEGTESHVEYSEGSNVGYRWYAARGTEPQFPFGYGLSYTRFEMTGLKLRDAQRVDATFRVRNTGERSGAVTTQLYLITAAGKPVRRLVGFKRLTLASGETQTVRLPIDPRLLAHWLQKSRGWEIDAGAYAFALGASATELGKPTDVRLGARHLLP